MAEKYSDYYTDESKIITLMNNGDAKQRKIALESLSVHFYKQKSRYKEFYDLCWRLFLSDENFSVRKIAFHVAISFASDKQLWKIIEDVFQNKYKEFKSLNPERNLLWELYNRKK